MEILGIMLSVPVAFVCCTLYCLFLAKVVSKHNAPSRLLRTSSPFILALFLVELILLIAFGAVRSRGLLGPGFYLVHIILFSLGPPALANVLVLRTGNRPPRPWYLAAIVCTVFAFVLVLLQYSVSESLYGIDGDNGPYSLSK